MTDGRDGHPDGAGPPRRRTVRTALRRCAHSRRIERLVITEAAEADLLTVARDGDRSLLGPASRVTRLVIDHAAGTVTLIWPEAIPDLVRSHRFRRNCHMATYRSENPLGSPGITFV